MKNLNRSAYAVPTLFLAMVALLTACGGTAYDPNLNGGNGGFVAGPSSNPLPNPSPSPTVGISGIPASTYSFTLTGQGTFNTKSASNPNSVLTTNSNLQVKVTAGAPSNLNSPYTGYSNFQATYSCIIYSVTLVNFDTGQQIGSAITTSPLYSGAGWGQQYDCPNSQPSQTIDFSSRIYAGSGRYAVKVQAISYDFYYQACVSYSYMGYYNPYTAGGSVSCSFYYPMHTIYQNHTTTGSLEVAVNGEVLE